MKDKEKQIEEMVRDLYGELYYDIAEHLFYYEKTAKSIIKKGWIKLPENSVVLSKEEYDELITKLRQRTELLSTYFAKSVRLEQASKETTEKVIMDFYHELITSFKGRVITYDSFCKIAKKHNVEIPRETFTLAELEAKHEDVEIKE